MQRVILTSTRRFSNFLFLLAAQERMARESTEERAHRARMTGYVFGKREGWDEKGSSFERGAAETVEAFARRCLAESRKIT